MPTIIRFQGNTLTIGNGGGMICQYKDGTIETCSDRELTRWTHNGIAPFPFFQW